jgi:uncharacterized membrane protein
MNHATALPGTPVPPVAAAPIAGLRIREIDVLRGLVIVLMVLDHVRDYFHVAAFDFDPLDPAATTPGLYVTRWITHLCAPTFVFLAGVSVWLQLSRGKSINRLSRFLLTRGLWLVALELTVLSFGWSFAFPYPLFMQVIWAIGWTMIALAGLVWLPRLAVLTIGLAIVVGHNLLDPITPQQLGDLGLLWTLLHEGGPIFAGGAPVGIAAYPVLPWIGVIAIGYGLGPIFEQAPMRRDRTIALLGLAMLVAFLLLRGFNLYGNPVPALEAGAGPYGPGRPWQEQDTPGAALMAFLDVQKYPPSLMFLLVTLGIVFVLWPLLARIRGPVAQVFAVFGAVPFFFYVLHVYLVHALAIAANAAAGRDPAGLFNYLINTFARPELLEPLGFPLPGVYLAWFVVLVLLYPLCRRWAELKARRRDWWLSYL